MRLVLGGVQGRDRTDLGVLTDAIRPGQGYARYMGLPPPLALAPSVPPEPPAPVGGLPRRRLWAGVAAAGAVALTGLAAAVGLVAYLWPWRAGREVDAGPVTDYPVGTVRHFQVQGSALPEGRAPLGGTLLRQARDFHLVRRPDGFVAFWHRCTHLGCAVPYRPQFEFPVQGRVERGLFRCPCHGSTFSRDEGEALFGPAPRPLDALPVRISRGRVLVTATVGSERQRTPGEPVPVTRA